MQANTFCCRKVTHGCKAGSSIVAFGGGLFNEFFCIFCISVLSESGLQEGPGFLESSGIFFMSIFVLLMCA